MRRFKRDLSVVLNSNIHDKKSGVDALKGEYSKLLKKIREKDQIPSQMIKKLERHITTLFHLMVNWIHYVEVIYMTEKKIQALRHSRVSLQSNLTENDKNQKEYMTKIFNSNKASENANYETVEEGATTDTAESAIESDHESKAKAKTQNEAESNKKDENPFGEGDGILGQLIEEEHSKEQLADEIKSFANPHKMFEGIEGLPQENDDDFGFGNFEVEHFKSRLQTKGNINNDDMLPSERLSNPNMDMYGIIEEIEEGNKEKSEKMKQKEQEQFIAQQLADLAESLDSEFINEIHSTRPTSGIDPYNPPTKFTQYVIEHQDKEKTNASLVLNSFYEKLQSLPTDRLLKSEVETLEKLKALLDYMGRIRILDAQVLAQIYENYRFKV